MSAELCVAVRRREGEGEPTYRRHIKLLELRDACEDALMKRVDRGCIAAVQRVTQLQVNSV